MDLFDPMLPRPNRVARSLHESLDGLGGLAFSILEFIGTSYTVETTMKVEEVPSMEEITTTVEIADRTGHTSLQLTKSETMSRIENSEGTWIFAGGKMVQPAQLAETDWGTVGTVRLVPGFIGGL